MSNWSQFKRAAFLGSILSAQRFCFCKDRIFRSSWIFINVVVSYIFPISKTGTIAVAIFWSHVALRGVEPIFRTIRESLVEGGFVVLVFARKVEFGSFAKLAIVCWCYISITSNIFHAIADRKNSNFSNVLIIELINRFQEVFSWCLLLI